MNNSNYPDDTSGYSRGFLTGTMTKVLVSDTRLYTAYYYDIEGHVTKKVQQNLLGGHDITTTAKGVKANMNQAEIDHVYPKSKGGTNKSSNAQVISKEENLRKSNKIQLYE